MSFEVEGKFNGNGPAELSRGIYFENLDALRFLAALLVVNAHLATLSTLPDSYVGKLLKIFLSFDGAGGDMGVSFFFVLSGFLITFLMLEENAITNSFSVQNFYVRRVLRIWPLYYCLLIIGFLLYPLVTCGSFDCAEPASVMRYVMFLANFDQIYFEGPHAEMLGVLWSVSVEEQFYLCWPLLFLLIRGRRGFMWMLVGMILFSNGFRVLGGHKFHTVTALSDLAIGALTAYVCFFYLDRVKSMLFKIGKGWTWIVYIAGILILVLNFQLNKRVPHYGDIDRFLHALFFAFVIVDQNFSVNSPIKMARIPFLSHWGKISYGIYMYHIVAILMAERFAAYWSLNFYISSLLAFLLTLIISELSYSYLERYFLSLKNKFVRM